MQLEWGQSSMKREDGVLRVLQYLGVHGGILAVEMPREAWGARWIDGIFGGALAVVWLIAAELKCVSSLAGPSTNERGWPGSQGQLLRRLHSRFIQRCSAESHVRPLHGDGVTPLTCTALLLARTDC